MSISLLLQLNPISLSPFLKIKHTKLNSSSTSCACVVILLSFEILPLLWREYMLGHHRNSCENSFTKKISWFFPFFFSTKQKKNKKTSVEENIYHKMVHIQEQAAQGNSLASSALRSIPKFLHYACNIMLLRV
jgi:hypothetical protein